jgi:hypothetical protein
LIKATKNGVFKITTVYGSTDRKLKDQFFAELIALKPSLGVRWLILGDFNQIRRARDKNKGNVDRSRLIRFRDALQACELNEYICKIVASLGPTKERARPYASLTLSIAMRSLIFALTRMSFTPSPRSRTIVAYSLRMLAAPRGQGLLDSKLLAQASGLR